MADRFIVDTSVWIDYFRGALRPYVFENLAEGIRLGLAAVTDVIRHEILVGARSERDFRNLLRLLSPLDCLTIGETELSDFDRFGWELRRRGLKGTYTDLSIAFLCQRRDLPLLSFDSYFRALEKKGILKLIQ